MTKKSLLFLFQKGERVVAERTAVLKPVGVIAGDRSLFENADMPVAVFEQLHFHVGFKIHSDVRFGKKAVVRICENQIVKAFVRVKHNKCLTFSVPHLNGAFIKIAATCTS